MPAFIPLIGPALAKIGMGSQLAGLINLTGAVGAASMIPMAFGAGQPSEEDQERMLRRQLEIQDEFEQGRAARAGAGMDDLSGLVGGGESPMSLAELIGERDLSEMAARSALTLDRFGRSRPKALDELDDILGGSTARIAQLQSERVLTPLEIIQMIEGGYG